MPERKFAGLSGAVVRRFAIVALLGASACSQLGPAYYGAIESPLNCAQARGYAEQGTASWYGKAHHGRRTANGERFDMNGLTAAHRRLPFGSRIRVTNVANGRSVVLTVNDRGPFVMGRFLDVSYRAAQALDFVRAGLASVRVETVESC